MNIPCQECDVAALVVISTTTVSVRPMIWILETRERIKAAALNAVLSEEGVELWKQTFKSF